MADPETETVSSPGLLSDPAFLNRLEPFIRRFLQENPGLDTGRYTYERTSVDTLPRYESVSECPPGYSSEAHIDDPTPEQPPVRPWVRQKLDKLVAVLHKKGIAIPNQQWLAARIRQVANEIAGDLRNTVISRPKQRLILAATSTRQVAEKFVGVLRTYRKPTCSAPDYVLLSHRQLLDWNNPEFKWDLQKVYRGISGFDRNMEALSPRSANIQSRPKATEGKVVAKISKDEKFATEPPELVIQPPRTGDTLAVKYRIGSFLGKGGFAICYEGTVQPPGKKPKVYALKIVKAHMNQPKMEDKFRTELQIHAKMHHQNIVKFYRAFTYIDSTYVVLELCSNGSIMDMVKTRRGLSMPEVRRFTIQLCGAIKYMHSRNVIHRDLKMGNLFLDQNMDLKLGDFGLAAVLVSPEEYKGAVKEANFLRRTTLCGTPNYIAPEILEKGKKGHDHKVDIWAIGVIEFAMITSYPPFQARSPNEIYRKAKEVEYEWPEDVNCQSIIPQEAKDLVASLLVVDAEARPDLDEIVGHPFFAMHGGKCIPMVMHPEARGKKPDYLDPAGPRGDTILAEHPTCWLSDFAKECGVGHLPNFPEPFQVVGGDVEASLYSACQIEEFKGTYPVVPLPKHMVYESTRPLTNSGELQQLQSSRSSFSDTDSVKIRSGRVRPPRPILSRQSIEDLGIGRPRPSQSHAAKLRARVRSGAHQTAHRATSTASTSSQVSASNTVSISSHGVTTSNDGPESTGSGREFRMSPVRPHGSNRGIGLRTISASGTSSRVTRSKKSEPISLSSDAPNGSTKLTSDQHLDQNYPNPEGVRRETAARKKARNASAVQSEATEPDGSDSVPVTSSWSGQLNQVPKPEPLRIVRATQSAMSKPPARASTFIQRSLSHRSRQVNKADIQQETMAQSYGRNTSILETEASEPPASGQRSLQSSYRSGNVPKSAVQQGKMPQTRGRVASAGQKDMSERSDSETASVRSSSKASVRSSASKWSTEVREPVLEPGEEATIRPRLVPPAQTDLPDSDKASVRSLNTHQAKQTPTSAPIIGPKDSAEYVRGTEPHEVLDKLCKLHEELSRSLSRAEIEHPPSNHVEKNLVRRPLVTRWVDYTNKFGIGYILSSGTVGSIFIGSEQSRSVCIAVAGAEEHFRHRKDTSYVECHQVIQQTGAHVEFVENWDVEGFKRVSMPPNKFQIEPDKNAKNLIKKFPARNANDAQKWRKIMYWEKFGIYMINQLARNEPDWNKARIEEQKNHDGSESSGGCDVDGSFIKFYQRLGNVGIWGFGDGSFQFNFPDHTKIVISDDGTRVDFYHLPIDCAKSVKRGHKVDGIDLANRSSLGYPVHIMLAGHCGKEDFREILWENCFEAKLRWMRDVVREWCNGGGLGYMSEENERMKWGGMSEKKGKDEDKEKFVWATVGCVGGDLPWYCEVEEKARHGAGEGSGRGAA